MANLRVKLCFLMEGYKISIATVTGVEESEVYGYGELAELQLSTGERYLAGATVPLEIPGEVSVDEEAVEPMGDYWCYRVIPIEDEDLDLVEYDEEGNVVPPPVETEEVKDVEKEKEKQNDETE